MKTLKLQIALTIGLVLIFSTLAVASGTQGHAEGPPHIAEGDLSRIFWHFFNLSILFIGLFILLRKQVSEFFANRGAHFEKAVAAAEKAKAEAEHHNVQIKAKLKTLEDTANSAVAKAKDEAAEMKKQMIEEAKRVANRTLTESTRMVEVETFGAAHHLKEEFVDLSINGARVFMKNSVTDAEQQRLSKEFIEKIQVI